MVSILCILNTLLTIALSIIIGYESKINRGQLLPNQLNARPSICVQEALLLLPLSYLCTLNIVIIVFIYFITSLYYFNRRS